MEALDILRQEHHSFAYLSSVFYILLYIGTINTHSSNSSQFMSSSKMTMHHSTGRKGSCKKPQQQYLANGYAQNWRGG